MNKPHRDDFQAAAALIRQSRAWAMVEGVARVLRISARHSWFAAAAGRLCGAIEALPRGERRRALSLAAAIAFSVHALLLGLVPAPLRPAVPRAFWLVLSAAAAVAAVRRGGKGQASDT